MSQEFVKVFTIATGIILITFVIPSFIIISIYL